MIFIKLLFKIRIFFFLIIIFSIACQEDIHASVEAFTSYLITEFPLPSGFREGQIHDLEFDENGFLYISTNGFLWIHDGITWHKIYTGDVVDITSSDTLGLLATNGTEIFTLGINVRKRFELRKLYNNPQETNPIQNIFFFQDHLVLTYKDRISYLKDNEEKDIADISESTRVFLTEKFIFLNNEVNTCRITGMLNKLNVPEIDFVISDLIDHPDGYLVFREDQVYPEIYSRDFKQLGFFRISASRFRDIRLFNHKKFVVLLNDNTIVITDKNGNKINQISNKKLNGKESSNILVSPENRIWQFNENFIRLVNYPSRLQEILTPFNFPVYDISTFSDDLYLATSEGIIYLQGEKPLDISRKVFSLLPFSGELFFVDEKGISVYNEEAGNIKNLFPEDEIILRGIEKNLLYSRDDSVYLLSHYNFSKNRFDKVFKKELNEHYTVAYPFLYNLSDSYIESLNLKKEDSEFITLPLSLQEEGIQGIFSFDNILWLYSPESIYYKDENDSLFHRLEFQKPSFIQYESIQSIDNHHLLGKIKSENSPGDFIIIDLEREEPEYFTIPSFPAYYSQYFIEDLNNDEFILGTSSELYLIKKSFKNEIKTFSPVIHKIIAGSDTILNGMSLRYATGTIRDKLMNIPFSRRDLLIGFGSPDFSSPNDIFQYRLGDNSSWSEWQEGDQIHLKDPSPGKYNLHIRLMGKDGNISDISSLNFNIDRPLFFSWMGLIIYGLIFIILLFILYKKIVLTRHKNKEGYKEKTQVKAFHREEPEEPDDGDVRARSEIVKRKAKWDKYQMVTVLFSDIQGFTRIAEQMNPEKLIDELDRFFFHFDSVVDKYHIEKIKTIGDAYMAAGGIPRKNRSNPVEVVLAALEMQQFMFQLKQTKVDFWDLRIGVHTGPVIAGVIGHKKRSYDIWGDTVNIASRMESSGEAGKVNISGETYQMVRDYFICEYRGKLPVKYKGNLDMYFVSGLRPELSVDLEGLPNRKFFLKLQLLRLNDLEDYVFMKLEDQTPESLKFHTPEYARQMYNFSELLSKAENLDAEETLLIRTAILMIPLGYLSNYMRPELESTFLCPELLSEFHYSEKQIQNISNLILASRYPPEPETFLEKIMVDIRFEYLGRVDFIESYKLLFNERNEHLENIEPSQWKEQQIKLLRNFNYYTSGARRLCEISFEKQIEKLMNEKWGQ